MKRRGWVVGHLEIMFFSLLFPLPEGDILESFCTLLVDTILLLLLQMVFTFPTPRTNVRFIFYITNRRRLILELRDSFYWDSID
jgi:hypothetical protein